MGATRNSLFAASLGLAVVFAGCGDGADMETTEDTVAEAGRDAREAVENAFASLRTDGERLVDEIQTRNAPEAKDQLLDRCRDALERLRQAESDQVDRVSSLCDRIRDTDVNNTEVWNQIKSEIESLR